MTRTDDLRIAEAQPLQTPRQLLTELPLTDEHADVIAGHRREIEAALSGSHRLICIVGPCSVHDPAALLDYACRFRDAVAPLTDVLLPVLRVYFEKPRSVTGWKGLINDPGLDDSFRINEGLHIARRLLLDVTNLGLPAASEFLDTTFGQYYADLISFGAIGARTVESQVHRELASGLSMPVGFKNGTSGNIRVAVDAIESARHPHWFPSLTKEGTPAILKSSGNEYGCLILRGGTDTGPNYDQHTVRTSAEMLESRGLLSAVIVDCSHGNSEKQHERQSDVARAVAAQIAAGETAIRGVMLESHLVAGRQDLTASMTYGQSITDACLSLDQTVPLLEHLAEAMRGIAPIR